MAKKLCFQPSKQFTLLCSWSSPTKKNAKLKKESQKYFINNLTILNTHAFCKQNYAEISSLRFYSSSWKPDLGIWWLYYQGVAGVGRLPQLLGHP